MKIRTFLALVGWLSLGAGQMRALDFTLRQMNIASEGISLSSSYISDGDSKIMLRIPNTWKVADSPETLDLLPDFPSSRVSLTQVKTSGLLPLDPGGKVELLKQAVAQIPSGAKKIEAFPEVDDLLPIDGWKTVEFTHRYEFFGQVMRRSVLFINMLPGRVVKMSVTAPNETFEKVHEQARVLMSHWFEPKRELSPEMARQYEEGKPFGT